MKQTVAFFSRTGTSRDIAHEIASRMNCDVVEISDSIKWSGFFGFLKGGFYATKDKAVEIRFDETCLASDEFVVVSPLWAGGPAPAARAFIRRVGDHKVRLLLTNDGSKIENAYKKTEAMFPSIIKKYAITKRAGNRNTVIEGLMEELSG